MGKKRKVSEKPKGFWASLFEPTPVKHYCKKPGSIDCWCGYAPDREMRP